MTTLPTLSFILFFCYTFSIFPSVSSWTITNAMHTSKMSGTLRRGFSSKFCSRCARYVPQQICIHSNFVAHILLQLVFLLLLSRLLLCCFCKQHICNIIIDFVCLLCAYLPSIVIVSNTFFGYFVNKQQKPTPHMF